MLQNADFSAEPSLQDFESLARRAMLAVSESIKAGLGVQEGSVKTAPVFASLLQQAIVASDKTRLSQALKIIREAGVSDGHVVDHYIPQVARDLGEAWTEDRLDFAAVSVGTAKLQSVLRALDQQREVPRLIPAYRPATVIVPEGCQHTLGASVLAQQLRRSAIDVTLEFDVGPERLRTLIGQGETGAVLVSATKHERLETLRALVDTAKSERNIPVLIGGNITEREEDVRDITGADYLGNQSQDVLPFLKTGAGV